LKPLREIIHPVTRHAPFFVLAAFALLLAAGTDLLIFDFVSETLCENEQENDGCFCCCAHIEIAAAPIALPSQPSEALEFWTDDGAVSLQVRAVYRPPRA
jgi:hypothetical protein